MAGSSAAFPVVLTSDSDDEIKEVPAVAPVAAEEQAAPAGEQLDDDVDGPSGLLPDGFEADGIYDDDGTFRATGYICPITGMKFGVISEVLDYCFSNGMERAIAAKDTLQDKTTLQGKYAWLLGKPGWALEIRAGHDNKKMFKFYVYLSTGIRLTSKSEVLRYMDDGELPESINEDCDTSTEDNIIAQLEFSIDSLPPGWVKETAFRKCSSGIRKDTFYTDPITRKVFRSLKAAEHYFISGGEPEDTRVPTMSVTDMYSFDGCTDMLPCLLKRLRPEGTGEHGQTSCHREEGWKGMYDNVKKEQDEEEWHGADEREEALHGDVEEEEDNEETIDGDGEEEENEQEVHHGDDHEKGKKAKAGKAKGKATTGTPGYSKTPKQSRRP